MNTTDTFYSKLPTEESIISLFGSFEAQDSQARENAEYRMQNYFNCVDDYSWGGLCDQAADQARNRRDFNRGLLKMQLEEGPQKETVTSPILCDLEGNIVSERLVRGKFGLCWIISTGQLESSVQFVGVAKKQATYEKKGYQVKTRKIEIEYYFRTRMTENGQLLFESRILSNEVVNEFCEVGNIHTSRVAQITILNK